MAKVRKIKEEKLFKVEGTFESLYAASKWCHDNGYSYGSLCRNEPVALRKGEYDLPQKWKNMYAYQKKSVDGVMISYDFREGEVKVIIYN
jgi:hypothetical protein